MIIELFTVLLVLCFALIIVGYVFDIPIIPMLGFIFLFLLSFTLINQDLQYKVGSNVTDDGMGNSVIINNYESYSGYSITFGKYLALVSALLFIISIIRESGAYDSWRENYEENNY